MESGIKLEDYLARGEVNGTYFRSDNKITSQGHTFYRLAERPGTDSVHLRVFPSKDGRCDDKPEVCSEDGSVCIVLRQHREDISVVANQSAA